MIVDPISASGGEHSNNMGGRERVLGLEGPREEGVLSQSRGGRQVANFTGLKKSPSLHPSKWCLLRVGYDVSIMESWQCTHGIASQGVNL